MELLNNNVINSENFNLLKNVLKSHYENRDDLKPLVTYTLFKETMISFAEEIMNVYLDGTEYSDDKWSCVVKKMPLFRKGEIDYKNDKILISEDVIKKIYLGNICEATTIFHELNHFKSEYDMNLGKIDKDIIRMLKERFLRMVSQDPFGEINSIKIKGGVSFINDDYYEHNYHLFSEEKIAEMNAVKNLTTFLEIAQINLSEQDLKQLKHKFQTNERQYGKYLRDFRSNFDFNDNYLDFEEAFDIMIKYYPGLLKISQFNVEYYIDESGKVVRKTKEMLEEMLKTETNEDIKRYIEYLLTSNKDKGLSKDVLSVKNSKRK